MGIAPFMVRLSEAQRAIFIIGFVTQFSIQIFFCERLRNDCMASP